MNWWGKKVWYVLRNPGKPNAPPGYPGIFAGISREVPEEFEKKRFVLGSQFPLREYKIPPENHGKSLKNYNVAHPVPVQKITKKS